MDANLVITAELEGMRRLARLDRPRIHVRQEDVPGASCIWNLDKQEGGHRDLVRLRPGSGVGLFETLESIRASQQRQAGGHLEIRGAAADLDEEAEFLAALGGREILTLPRALMARRVGAAADDVAPLDSGLTVSVADTPESLAALRVVVAQSFAGRNEADSRPSDVEADFFHAPGVMTYLAVRDRDGGVISTGSILVVDGVANVWSVATAPSARGRGAASAIMRAVCLEAPKRGAEFAALRTTDELARPGGLYSAVGFELLGHERIWELDNIDDVDL
jgi:GNAT superfamily N-acetyltransferase